jgi:bacillithiol system protein YtxJ
MDSLIKPQSLHSWAEFQTLLAASEAAPLLLYKHSSTCPISARAFREVENFLNEDALAHMHPQASAKASAKTQKKTPKPATAPLLVAMVVVQDARNVSNAIAEHTGIRHESPQAIFFHHSTAVWNDSHNGITALRLQQALAEIRQ